MHSLLLSFENPTSKIDNTWFFVRPTDYLIPIENSGMCYINIKQNSEDAWILGQDFMNQYDICFNLEHTTFSIRQPYQLTKLIESNYQPVTPPYITKAELVQDAAILGATTTYLGYLVYSFISYANERKRLDDLKNAADGNTNSTTPIL